MAVREVREMGDPILNKVCKEVKELNERTLELIDDMFDTMYETNGVGLAAPQVGILKRIVVIDTTGEDPVLMMNPRIIGNITTEILLFSAQNDKVVHTAPHKRLAKLLPKCTLITVPHAKHTLYTGSYSMLEHFYTTVFNFLGSNNSE
jgi:pimeloyl-ACP methyl ester carboxylesterase